MNRIFPKLVPCLLLTSFLVLLFKWQADSCLVDRGSQIFSSSLFLPSACCGVIRGWEKFALSEGAELGVPFGVFSSEAFKSVFFSSGGVLRASSFVFGFTSLPLMLTQVPAVFPTLLSLIVFIILLAFLVSFFGKYLIQLIRFVFPKRKKNGPRRRITATYKIFGDSIRSVSRRRGRFK